MIFIGIDIGSCAVKAVVLKKLQQTFQIIKTHFFPIHLDDSEEKQKLDKKNYLKTLAKLYKNQEARYIICLPQNQVSTHALSFPFKERYKITKTLQFELEDRLLFSYEQLISDIMITKSGKQKTDVLVFSTLKDNIIKNLNYFKEAGIKATIFTCEASAISNIIENRDNFQKKTIKTKKNPENEISPKEQMDGNLYLKIGHTHSTVFVLENGRIQNLYNFEWGASSYIRKTAVKYEISFHKAMEHVCEQGFVLTQTKGYTGSQIAFSKIISESFDSLIHQIQLLILHLKGDKNYNFKKLFIFGGGAQIRNLQTLFSQKLHIPVSRLEHPMGLPNWNLRQNNNDKHINLVTALGSAMEGLRKFNNPSVNFLKGKFAVKFNPVSLIYSKWKQPVILGIISLAALFFYANIRKHQSEKLLNKIGQLFQRTATATTQMPSRNITEKQVQRFIDNRKEVLKNLSLTQQLTSLPSALDRLKSVSVAINKNKAWNLEIQKLHIDHHRKIEIQGKILKPYIKNFENNLLDIAQKDSLKAIPEQTESLKNKETNSNMNIMADTNEDNIFFAYVFTQKTGNE